ncbi:HAD-like domain-containing protein [Coprinopsis sp. MPI-PUGE-AT-0042]|nr:HAD-like domain-containing protein [Coprinopsis sp. MPI-PUGE-AT-0042]
MKLPITSIIFDLGDVLFNWSCDVTIVPKETLRAILTSSTWNEYECGRPNEEDVCYTQVGNDVFGHARDSLTPDARMFNLIKELKRSHKDLKVFAMSNISAPDWKVLQPKLDTSRWGLFDARFPSCEAGVRKPDPEFFKHVIHKANIDPKSTIFVDDNASNIETAKALGFYAIRFENTEQAMGDLVKAFKYSDAVARGRQYLDANKKQHFSGDGIVIGDNFASLLILEATKDPELVDIEKCQETWNFFIGGQLTTHAFPDDVDTTSIAYTALHGHEGLPCVMDKILTCRNSDGIMQTYFDASRPRVDPVVCANLTKTLEYVLESVSSPRLARLLMKTKDDELKNALFPLLKKRVEARKDLEVDAMTLALRLMACNFVGVKNQEAVDKLLSLQCEDGGWELGWIYKYGSSGWLIGNRGLTTAYAIKAIQGLVY